MARAWTDPLVGDEEPDPQTVALMSADAADAALAQLFARPAWYVRAACRGAATRRGRGFDASRVNVGWKA